MFIYVSSPLLRLEMKITKSSGGMPRLSYTGRDDRHFLPSGLYIIKTVNGERGAQWEENVSWAVAWAVIHICFIFYVPSDPWTMAFSKSSKRKFFYNKQTKESTYDLPPSSVAPFQWVEQSWYKAFWQHISIYFLLEINVSNKSTVIIQNKQRNIWNKRKMINSKAIW